MFPPQVSDQEAGCSEACAACFGWRPAAAAAAAVGSDVCSAGCSSVVQLGQAPARMRPRQRTCLDLSLREDGEQREGVWQRGTARGRCVMCLFLYAAEDDRLSGEPALMIQ